MKKKKKMQNVLTKGDTLLNKDVPERFILSSTRMRFE